MYSHTENENGTYNTRCLDCLMTIASSVKTDEELYRVEMLHLCPERVLSEVFKCEIEHRQKVA